MSSSQQRAKQTILVVDDDEVALTAVADLLEEAGYDVVTLSSPVGAADTAVEAQAVAAVIDLNMPVMRGDNVIRLFRSRAQVRDLPVVLLSSEGPEKLERLQQGMRDLTVVGKTSMESLLVPTLRSVIGRSAERGQTQRAWGASSPPERKSDTAAISWPGFLDSLEAALKLLKNVLNEVQRGRFARVPGMVDEFEGLARQARTLKMPQTAQLLGLLGEVVLAVRPGSAIDMDTRASVDKAVASLSSLRHGPQSDFTLPVTPLLIGLRQACNELKAL